MGMYTDPNRIRADIPGKVEGNPVFTYHDLFNQDSNQIRDFKDRYRQGKVGDVEVKQELVLVINKFLDPIRRRRQELFESPELILDILNDGAKRMQIESEETLLLVREAMGLQKYQSENPPQNYQSTNVLRGLAFM